MTSRRRTALDATGDTSPVGRWSVAPARFLTPAWLIGVPVLLSLAVWAVPGTSLLLRGFDIRTPLELPGVLLLATWYLSAILLATAGMAVGRAIPAIPVVVRAQSRPEFLGAFVAVVTVIALVGVVGTYLVIAREHSIIDEILGGTANVLSQDLQSGSSIATLRYAAIVAAPAAVYFWLARRRSISRAAGAVLAILLLLATSLLSSRLSLLMSLTALVVMLVLASPRLRIRLWIIGLAAVVLFALLTIFNFVRNNQFYAMLGVSDPISMNFFQLAAYAGAPMQVSLGLANGIMAGRYVGPSDLQAASEALVPTFLRGESDRSDRATAIDPGAYGYQVEVASNLNANSAFAELFSRYGWWGLVFGLIALAIVAVVLGYATRFGPPVTLAAGVLAYTLIDFWRTYLFMTGVVIFCVGLVAGATALATGWTAYRRRRRGSRS